MSDPNDILSQLTPEQLQQVLQGQFQLGGLNEQDAFLQDQLARAEALRNRPAAQGYGALGGVGAGLTNAFNGINSAMQQRSATQGIQGNMAKAGELRGKLAGTYGDLARMRADAIRNYKPPQAVPEYLARDDDENNEGDPKTY